MTHKRFKTSLFLFHRDLRLDDNTGLIEALKQSEKVMPVFILEDTQISQKNRYRSLPALCFMQASLEELNAELNKKSTQLYLFKGNTASILDELIKQQSIQAIYSNRDYTPFARKRDEKIKTLCQKNEVQFSSYNDALLTSPESIHKDDGKPYTIYTPFFRKASQLNIPEPQSNPYKNYVSEKIKGASMNHLNELEVNRGSNLLLKGGRKEGLKLIKSIKQLKNYEELRNIPAKPQGTSHLSAHHKFGTVSIRETYQATLHFLGPDSSFISELFWRDFFSHIAFHFPRVFEGCFHQKYDQIPWENDKKKFKAWCEGKTGFPIIDAGMRELNETGYMHNRVRMIVASFLTKDLHVDWRWGEQYFARKLIDYDPAVNNGNWQWAASTGCDAQPYFRIFNPMLQHKHYDPDSEYTKKWVPELKKLCEKEILKLYELKIEPPSSYPKAIANHKQVIQWSKDIYKI